MGDVYLASHARLSRRFAIKILNPQVAKNPEAFARFRREAQITSELGHPHIVQVIDFNTTDDGAPYLVMEYLEGENLDQRLQKLGKLPVDAALIVAERIGSALAAAHAKGVVHRDLKPENIFLREVPDDPWFVKILDFGISKIRGATSILTQEHTILGTPYYMSPEQAEGKNDLVDHRTDQFALATILYEMLTGDSPFNADTIPSVLYLVVHRDPKPAHEVDSGISPRIGMALARAMAKAPEDRFDSIGAFVKALRGIPDGVDTGRVLVKTGDKPDEPRARVDPLAATTASAELSLTESVSLDVPPVASKKKRWAAAGLGGVVIAGLVAVLVAGGGKDETAAPEPAEAVAAPMPAAVAIDAGPAIDAAVPKISVRLRSRPKADRITVDGKPVTGGRILLPKDGAEHTVRFEKRGYQVEKVVFDAEANQIVRVQLVRERKRRPRRVHRQRLTPKKRQDDRRGDKTREKPSDDGFILDL